MTTRLQQRVKVAMPFEQLLPLAILAFVGSFTPGPSNMIATVTGANHGFRAALPYIFGVPFGFASMLIAGAVGVAALLIKWAGIPTCFSLLAARSPKGDRQRVRCHDHETAFVLAVRCLSVCEPEGMDARGRNRRVVHDEPSDVRQYRDRVFDCGNGQSYHLGVGWLRSATLAQRRLANAYF